MTILFRVALAAMLACALAPGLAAAQAAAVNLGRMTMAYSYYNRPGATLAMHHEAVGECILQASETKAFNENLRNTPGLLNAIIEDFAANARRRSSVAAGLENCMVVLGWRVVTLPEAEGKALAALAPETLAERLAPWVGAETPPGVVVRLWGNDAANAATTRWATNPGRIDDGQLSLTALTSAALPQFKANNQPSSYLGSTAKLGVQPDKKWSVRPLKPKDIATAVPEGGAVIMMDLRGVSLRNGIGFQLNRMGPEVGIWPSTVDGGTDLVYMMVGLFAAKKEGNMVAIAVPPGRWRIHGMNLVPMLNFCLGSPAFEVKAGEVVYAGAFDFAAPTIGPDLSLDRARAWLGDQAAAQTVRAAAYVNGTRGVCGNDAIYAFEVPGAPFEPRYVGGSIPVPLGDPSMHVPTP